jgi:hypothetical protein
MADDDTVKGAAASAAESREGASTPGTADSNNDSDSAGVGQNGQEQHTANGGSPQTIAEAAAYYHDNRGWNPVPVSRRTKKPFEKEWQNLPYSPERFTQRKVLNVSIQLGPRSGWLVDVDLDSKEALAFADYFLPSTDGVFGRLSKPRSHRLYIADFSFEGEKAVIQFKDGDATIVELRIGAGGKGASTVVPPSVHESGERIEWEKGKNQPTPVDARELKESVVRLAVACLLAPRYPQRGSRHEAVLVIGGVLARAGWPAKDIEHLVTVVARSAGCSSWADHAKTAASAVAARAKGVHVSGLNRLAEVWGEDVVDAFVKWGIGGGRKRRIISSGKPVIKIEPEERKGIIDRVEATLLQNDIYQRGGLIVRIDYETMKTWDERDAEVQVISECDNEFLRETVDALCTFVKWDGRSKQDVVCDPPDWISPTLKGRKTRLRLPVLNGVSNCPILRANGEVITEPGYHAATGLYYDPRGITFPEIARTPSRLDAMRALGRIKRLFHTFPWVGADRIHNPNISVALSYLLTSVARRALDFAILHAFDAPTAGTGKSMISDIVSLVATGDRAAVVAYTEDQAEFDKLFDAKLMYGASLIPIDNCDGPLKGVKLNQAITQPVVSCRILGVSKFVLVRSLATISANGNNLVLEGDLTRRAACGRMDAGCERPELLKFDYSPLRDAAENRAELVSAALTVLRAYHVAGKPVRQLLGGFEEWSTLIRGALIWLGEADPLETMEDLRGADTVQSSLYAVMHEWKKHWPLGTPVTAAEMVKKANEWEPSQGGYVNPEWRDALMVIAASGSTLSSARLGTWLGRNKNRILSGMRIVPGVKHYGNQQWVLSAVQVK